MKVLFLGIDALDSDLLTRFSDRLPNFKRFLTTAVRLDVASTFPPDSDTAWATISTGLNPAQHGYVKFVDPLEKSYRIMNTDEDNSILHGNTFWDILGRAGFSACAVFPHLCYPIWETPAVMICRGKLNPDVQATNPELLAHYPDAEILPGIRGFPDRSFSGMSDYYRTLTRIAEADAKFGLSLLKEKNWDLFFIYWSTIDAIGHFFWSTFDENDPFYDPGNPFREVIADTYRLYDKILGNFLDAVDEDTTVILLSDHGHGARPVNAVNVNEILRQGGFLKLLDAKAKPHLSLFEQLKRSGVRFVSRHGLARQAGRILRHVPKIVQAFTRPTLIDWDASAAFATDMSGIKAYAYGGIVINRDVVPASEIERVRSEIIHTIREKSTLEDGSSLLKFIARREDVYQGPYLQLFPDIILEYRYGYGVGWAVNVSLITKADSYNLVPGSHRGETGTCIIRSQRNIITSQIDLLDILPSLLDLFSVAPPRAYDGKSIFGR